MLLQNYKQLSKAKLSALVVLTGAAGFVAGSEEDIDWKKLGWTLLGTFGAAACANTLNQVYEVVNDGMMKRTQNRPLPTGRMGRAHALAFAAVMGVGGLGILATQVRLPSRWRRHMGRCQVPARDQWRPAKMLGRAALALAPDLSARASTLPLRHPRGAQRARRHAHAVLCRLAPLRPPDPPCTPTHPAPLRRRPTA
jgi:hypothetical protein